MYVYNFLIEQYMSILEYKSVQHIRMDCEHYICQNSAGRAGSYGAVNLR